ncbi:MAG: AMP-binding protein, partial [candidate division Zixibacteria bacterium]|nr:AMP-binding protein [candidate division Zixibacteria bacterium]
MMIPNEAGNNSEPQSLYAAFESAALRFPDRIALKGDGGRGLTLTYSQVLDSVKRLAAGLQAPEYVDLREIGLLSENRPEWPVAYLAIVASGKTVVPLDATLKSNEIEALLRVAGLTTIFVSERFEKMVEDLDPGLRVFSFESSSASHWQRLMSNLVDFTPLSSRDNTAVLIYTSGTTGTPKAVVLTHGNILANLKGIQHAIHIDEHDVYLSLLPLHHTFEATCGFLTPLTCGAMVVYTRTLKSREIREDIAANEVSIMCGVPLLFEKLYHAMHRNVQSTSLYRRAMFRALFACSAVGWGMRRKWGRTLFAPLLRKAGMGKVRLFVSGAAALPTHISRFFCLIGIDLLQGYGMTETAPVISVTHPDDIRLGSVGPPLIGVDVRIDNPDEHGVGEITVRGDNCTPGYRNSPEQTAELWRDGWLHTGDLGRIKEGHLWITGRAKNLIISAAGKNIYPEEIEERLLTSDLVLESVVFGQKKQGRQGEEVRALIVPDLDQLEAEFGIDQANP